MNAPSKQNQTITFGALANKTYGDADFTVSATASSGLPVSFSASGNCTVSGSSVHITGAGSCTITASQGGNDSYYPAQDVSRSFSIAKADADCSVSGYSGVYDAVAHGASGSCSGVGGENAGTLDLGATFKDVPGGTANWSFTGNSNYNDQSGDVAITITKADATCSVSGYTGVYDAAAHGASGSCSGIGGESAGTLALGDSFTNVPGGTAHWVFTGNGNYNDKSGDVAIEISKAEATCTVSGYTGVYDAASHGASGSCSGIGGGTVGTLDLGDSFKDVPGGTAHWTFTSTNPNYKDSSGDVAITITKADATCSVSGYTGVYDAVAHGASGSCSGIGGESAGTLALGETFKDVPGGTAHWVFTGNGNYNDQEGDAAIAISKADATCTVTGYTGYYDGVAHGATGSCSGIGGESAGTLNLGATFTNVPGGTAHWVFTGNGNYKDQSGDVAIVINPWTLTGFYQPVDMNGVYNTVKGGSTVPLKFEIFAGNTELTDTSFVDGFTTVQVTCSAGAVTDEIETLTTGQTVLRYDSTGGQFIFNWKTPSGTAGKCFRVTMKTDDGSSLVAYFKMK